MIPLIPIALELAQFAPSLMRYFGVGEASAAVADKVVDIAKQVTGLSDPATVVAGIKADPELQIKFRQFCIEQDNSMETLYVNDIKDARARDVELRKAGQKNYRADIMAAGSFAVVLLMAILVWTKPDVNDYVKGIVTLILGRFLGYTDQIFQFEFGAVRDKLFGKNKNGS